MQLFLDGKKANINLLVHLFFSIFYIPGIILTSGNLDSDERNRKKKNKPKTNLTESVTNAMRESFKGPDEAGRSNT